MEETRIEKADAAELAKEHYTEYSIYVNTTRALASAYDGFKTVQRRIVYEANKLPDKLVKSAFLVGNAIKLHPHASESIYGALVNMASPTSNFKLFDTQGNFGGFGFPAAAERYTECKLSKLARFVYCQFVDYAPMEIGEIGIMEPTYLPSLLPYGLIEGTSGIGVGLAVDTVPMNIIDVIDYYLDYIKNGTFDFSKTPKPDFGSSIIKLQDNECSDVVNSYKGNFPIISTINRESENIFVVETLYGVNINKVLQKLGKYIDTEKVDFRNETKTSERYVFEIVDKSVDPEEFRKDLEKATFKRVSFSRVFDVDQKSVYCPFNYVIEKQMKALNKAIDLKVDTELKNYMKKSELLRALEFFKNEGLFKDLVRKTSEDVVNEMMTYKKLLSCLADNKIDLTEELCYNILKKPISYLTKSHNSEIDDIEKNITDLKNHDRKSYLIELYEKLKTMVQDEYNKKKHSILVSQLITDPKVRLQSSGDSQTIEVVKRGKGCRFDKFVYLIGENGFIYRRSISAVTKTNIPIDVDTKIVDIISDKCRYVEFITQNNERLCFDLNNYRYDKQIVNLADDGEFRQWIVKANGYGDEEFPNELRGYIRSKLSKPMK